MKRPLIILLGSSVAFAIGWKSLTSEATITYSLKGLEGDVGRGAYLARASGCIACHTDVVNGGAALAGGPPLKTPFGTFYAPNLTTDKVHGIGDWNIDDFSSALRSGKSPQGDSYYPAFPYTFYTKLSDQDIADLWAAFKTVPAIGVSAKDHELGFPFNQRSGLTLWQALFFNEERFQPDTSKGEKFTRGAYLVEAATHCAACHSERNLLGALDQDNPFTGSESMLEGEGRVPAITKQALLEKGWTELDLAYALKSGLKHDGDAFGGSMGEVVRDGTSFMRKADREAIAYYLMNK
ncbi:c-type cytochrome [Neptuniibacter sp. QD37_6]|uniref:c-type cytochrome n=1 Tax=Neptuniibacter sp. QD37_6 TaxID=3398210 RepID=UPI0039F5C5C4